MGQISIAVLDDHPFIAEGIRRVVEQTPDIQFCGSAINLSEFNILLRNNNVDVAIIDVRLNGESVETICKTVRKSYPTIKILIFSSFFDQMILRKTFAAGASGYALKSIALNVLPAAIRQVSSGGIFLSQEIAVDAILPKTETGSSKLSRREQLIIEMVADGKTNKEIAILLGISYHTVKLHVSRLLKKFNLRVRSQIPSLAEP
jgi:DNA-binding NarL/FixJ family response regulator